MFAAVKFSNRQLYPSAYSSEDTELKRINCMYKRCIKKEYPGDGVFPFQYMDDDMLTTLTNFYGNLVFLDKEDYFGVVVWRGMSIEKLSRPIKIRLCGFLFAMVVHECTL